MCVGGVRVRGSFFFNIIFVLCCVAFGFLRNDLILAAQVSLDLNMTCSGWY